MNNIAKKTKEQLVNELKNLHQRIIELETTGSKNIQVKDTQHGGWHSLVQYIPNIIMSVDRDGKIIALNRTPIEDIIAYDKIGLNIYDYVAPEHQGMLKEIMETCFTTGEENTYEILSIGANGPNTAWYETRIIPVKMNKRFTYAILISTDITEKKQKGLNSQKTGKEFYDNALVGMLTTDHKSIITSINEFGYTMFGYSSKNDVIGKLTMTENCVDPDDKRTIIKELIQKGEITEFEAQFKRKDGSTFWGEIAFRIYQDKGKIEGIIIDVTKRKNAEKRVFNLTYYDQLTNLPNKDMFKSFIEMEIKKAKNRERGNLFAVLCLGVDKFKNINNIYGSAIGDSLLKNIAKRLENTVYEKDRISRYDGDKFMIAFSDIASRDDAGRLVRKISDVFEEPFCIENINLNISAKMGVCLYPKDGDTPDLLLENSETAMYMAKDRGIISHFYDKQLNSQVLKRLQLEKELRNAIKKEEFVSYYQPRVACDGLIIGVESLIRWQSLKRGLVYPLEFIPLMEKNGMIIDVGDFILMQSCVQNKKWQEKGYNSIRVSVNLSAFQFSQRNLVKNIEETLNRTGLDPEWLELEITESGILENEKDSIEKLNDIHALGVSISIDDFGTGYSSLSKLKNFPIDTLKIDKSFIDNIPTDKNSATIVTTIIDLGHNLGFNVVAEGVEQKEQFDFLVASGCDQFQGYYFSEPLPSEMLEDIMN